MESLEKQKPLRVNITVLVQQIPEIYMFTYRPKSLVARIVGFSLYRVGIKYEQSKYPYNENYDVNENLEVAVM